MSTNIKGFKSKESELYKKHSAVLRACLDAEISILPKETAYFFGADVSEEYLFEEKLIVELSTTEYHDDCESGYELKVSDIPEDVDIIRFYNSY